MTFTGFPHEGIDFLTELKFNNEKAWFDEHKKDYERYIKEPAKLFIESLGEKLQSFAPNVVADTRMNGAGSMMRIYRDVRFSEDKTPYKTHASFVFWEGKRKRTENPSFFLRFNQHEFGLYAGVHTIMDKDLLEGFRQAVAKDKTGKEVADIITELEGHAYSLGEPHLKRVPRGFEKDHPRAELLKYKGFGFFSGELDPKVVTTPAMIEVCMEHFSKMAPLHQWMVKVFDGV